MDKKRFGLVHAAPLPENDSEKNEAIVGMVVDLLKESEAYKPDYNTIEFIVNAFGLLSVGMKWKER